MEDMESSDSIELTGKVVATKQPGINQEDCFFYYYSSCAKGNSCPYRHEPAALGNETVCRFWAQGLCMKQNCTFRHLEVAVPKNQVPCYFEQQPGGCKKAHCPFYHNSSEDSNVKKRLVEKTNSPADTSPHASSTNSPNESRSVSPVPFFSSFVITLSDSESDDGEVDQEKEPEPKPCSSMDENIREMEIVKEIQKEQARVMGHPLPPIEPNRIWSTKQVKQPSLPQQMFVDEVEDVFEEVPSSASKDSSPVLVPANHPEVIPSQNSPPVSRRNHPPVLPPSNSPPGPRRNHPSVLRPTSSPPVFPRSNHPPVCPPSSNSLVPRAINPPILPRTTHPPLVSPVNYPAYPPVNHPILPRVSYPSVPANYPPGLPPANHPAVFPPTNHLPVIPPANHAVVSAPPCHPPVLLRSNNPSVPLPPVHPPVIPPENYPPVQSSLFNISTISSIREDEPSPSVETPRNGMLSSYVPSSPRDHVRDDRPRVLASTPLSGPGEVRERRFRRGGVASAILTRTLGPSSKSMSVQPPTEAPSLRNKSFHDRFDGRMLSFSDAQTDFSPPNYASGRNNFEFSNRYNDSFSPNGDQFSKDIPRKTGVNTTYKEDRLTHRIMRPHRGFSNSNNGHPRNRLKTADCRMDCRSNNFSNGLGRKTASLPNGIHIKSLEEIRREKAAKQVLGESHNSRESSPKRRLSSMHTETDSKRFRSNPTAKS